MVFKIFRPFFPTIEKPASFYAPYIGVYGMYTDGEINGGFHFAIPLPGKKWSRNPGVRVRQADYFAMEYSMESWGRYADEKMGETYRTRPDENRSNRFFQPEYIRYFLIKEANK